MTPIGIMQNLLRLGNRSRLGQALIYYSRSLEAAGEPLLAFEVLGALPAALKEDPEVATERQRLEGKTAHCRSWEEYCKRYEKDDREPLSDKGLLRLPRYELAFALLKQFSPTPERVLSFGVGEGTVEDALLSRTPSVKHLTGVDCASNRLRTLDALRSRHPSIDFQSHKSTGFYSVPFEAGFDLIWLCEVLEHVPEPNELLRAVRSRLVSGGHLVLTTPDGSLWYEPDLPFRDSWSDHVTAQTPGTVIALLKSCGFEVLGGDVTHDGTIVLLAKAI